MTKKIPIGIIGATGYTGIELARLAVKHPYIEIAALTSEKSAGSIYSKLYPAFQSILDLELISFHPETIAPKIKVAFLCLPHQEAMEAARALINLGVIVIDLSADFRIKNVAEYEAWYGKHLAPELLSEAVYGLPELNRADIKQARLIANPGCYPTSAALALLPLFHHNLIQKEGIILDSKSGASGAGRSAKTENLFCEINEGFKAYKVAGTHRHIPEIEQTLSIAAGYPLTVTFTPHLLPMDRGILTTAYALPTEPVSNERLHALFTEFYKNEPFVRVKPSGILPSTKDVFQSNFCDVAPVFDSRTKRVIVISAIDNLTKGASGQALQNFNLRMGFEETVGLS